MTFIEWFIDQDDVSTYVLALIIYLQHRQEQNLDRPFTISTEEIAFDLHCSNFSVCKARKALVGAGWIEYKRYGAEDKRKSLYSVKKEI